MAQNVVINGVTYSAVPEVDIPKSGGGTAKFYDTAGADISASDVLADPSQRVASTPTRSGTARTKRLSSVRSATS